MFQQPFSKEADDFEPMEYEYTSAQPHFDADRFGRHGSPYTFPRPGTFHIPESFFSTNYKRSIALSDAICDKINSFSLNEPVEESKQPSVEQKEPIVLESVQKEPEKEPQSLVIFSPVISPQIVQEPATNNSPVVSPVDQDTIPLQAPVTSSFTPSPAYYNHNYNYFPPPPDPVVQSRTRIHFIGQLIKLALITIAICAIMHTFIHAVGLIKFDLNEKIQERETVIVQEKSNCRKAYDLNRCSSDVIVPAVVPMCRKWETCIYEPIVINRAKLLGESIGSMINGFFEQLSLQSKFVLIVITLTTIWAFKGIIVAQVS